MSPERKERVSRAGIVLGVGLGGFLDGIALHQILQWHNMLSNWIPPHTMDAMRLNMVWDGLFHAFVWLVSLAGTFMLWRAAYRRQPIPSLAAFVGQLIFGFGAFNLVEGVIDHQLLALHYVRQVPNYTVYNLSFLAVGGVLMLIVGWVLMRSGGAADTTRARR